MPIGLSLNLFGVPAPWVIKLINPKCSLDKKTELKTFPRNLHMGPLVDLALFGLMLVVVRLKQSCYVARRSSGGCLSLSSAGIPVL